MLVSLFLLFCIGIRFSSSSFVLARLSADDYCNADGCFLMGYAENCDVFSLRHECGLQYIYAPILKPVSDGTNELEFTQWVVRIDSDSTQNYAWKCPWAGYRELISLEEYVGTVEKPGKLENCSDVIETLRNSSAGVHQLLNVENVVLEYFLLAVSRSQFTCLINKMRGRRVELYWRDDIDDVINRFVQSSCSPARILFDMMAHCQKKLNLSEGKMDTCAEPRIKIKLPITTTRGSTITTSAAPAISTENTPPSSAAETLETMQDNSSTTTTPSVTCQDAIDAEFQAITGEHPPYVYARMHREITTLRGLECRFMPWHCRAPIRRMTHLYITLRNGLCSPSVLAVSQAACNPRDVQEIEKLCRTLLLMTMLFGPPF